MKGTTQRQEEVLEAIRRYTAQRGYPPTIRDLGAELGVKSTNGVNDHLRFLEKKGLIVRDRLVARSIRVVGDADIGPPDSWAQPRGMAPVAAWRVILAEVLRASTTPSSERVRGIALLAERPTALLASGELPASLAARVEAAVGKLPAELGTDWVTVAARYLVADPASGTWVPAAGALGVHPSQAWAAGRVRFVMWCLERYPNLHTLVRHAA